MGAKVKETIWLNTEIANPPFSPVAKREAGHLIWFLQSGDSIGMPHSRSMPSIGKNCHELRITDKNSIFRIVYRIDSDAIVIVDIFKKKTRATPKSVIDKCKTRLKNYDALTK